MCIAVYKPAGAKFPSKTKIKTMFKNNPDGAGFMYADGQTVHIVKGLMTVSDFNRELNKVRDIDKPFALHFRITTHGATSKGLCHPFPLSDDLRELTATETDTDIGIVHNGMIPITDYATKISDTAEFIRRYGVKLLANGCDADMLHCIEALIHSKMIILEASGDAHLLGDFVQDGNGVYYSNESYKPATKTKTTYTSKYMDWYDGGLYNHCDGLCEYCKTEYKCMGFWSWCNPYAPENYNKGGGDVYSNINC